jgi:NIMA (never in mitosis gene a)-related kinase 1/4/5
MNPSSLSDFSIVQSLGKGSYGNVLRVVRKADGYTYAIKEINIRKLSTREREDALNEIRVMASIRHPNIVRYCDAFMEKDNLYIVMEFAEHGDIGRQVSRSAHLNGSNDYFHFSCLLNFSLPINPFLYLI